jgi:hypothetical protein
MFFVVVSLTLLSLTLLMVMASCGLSAPMQPTSEPDVPLKNGSRLEDRPSFATDIQPILNEYCITCHGPERAEKALRLDSYDHTMRGTLSGAVVIPGWPEASPLVYVLRRPESQDIGMPYHGKKLSPNRIKNVMFWIEAGALDN